MKKRIVIALLAACSLTVFTVPAVGERIVMAEEKSPEEEGNMYFSSLNADEVNIKDTSIYTIRLKAKEGWQFDVDVTQM